MDFTGNADRVAAYASKWLGAADLAAERTRATIANVTLEEVEGRGGSVEKLALHFKEALKPLLLNKTNVRSLKEVTGSAMASDWIGQQIVLRRTETSSPDGMVPCIRVEWLPVDATVKALATAAIDEDSPGDEDLPF